jgi:hypothetical protein
VVADGAFIEEERTLQFVPAIIGQADVRQTEENIRHWVLHYLRKKGVLTPYEMDRMLAKEKSGFSLDGSVQVCS